MQKLKLSLDALRVDSFHPEDVAAVRGTVWSTADRCDGTLTTVKRGKVAVRDLRRKRTVTVESGAEKDRALSSRLRTTWPSRLSCPSTL